MKNVKIFCVAILFLFSFLNFSAFALDFDEAEEKLRNFLEDKELISPTEDLVYLETNAEYDGENCWEFAVQFGMAGSASETARYAISESGKIYELSENNFKLLSSKSVAKTSTSNSTSNSKSDDSDDDDNNAFLNFDDDDEDENEDYENETEQTSSKNFPLQRSTRGTKVNLRTRPDAESDSILKLYEGTPIEVLAEKNNWYKVKIPDGDTGWIFGEFIVNRLGDKGSHGGNYMSISADDVHLRSSYSRKSASIMKLNEGNLVEGVGKKSRSDGTWYNVYTRDGTQGWVFGKYVKRRSYY